MASRTAMILAAVCLSAFALAGCGPGQPFGPTLTPTPSPTATDTPTATPTSTPTSTETPAITLTPTPLPGTIYYLLINWTLDTAPPNYPQANFWCSSCAPTDLSTYSWSLKLTEPRSANDYRYAVVSSDAVVKIRIKYSHGGKEIGLAEWDGNINLTDEKPGTIMNAVAGDTLTVEIDIKGNGQFWLEDGADYSCVTLIQS
jgi:hypothetical protein